MDLRENAELIRFYLSLLKIQRQEFIDNYQPTHWELLTPKEQEKIVERNLLDRQTEQLEAQIAINNFFRQHRERKRILRLEKSKSLLHIQILRLTNVKTYSKHFSRSVIQQQHLP